MAQQEKYDLVVIGGGPAGYAGAIRAGQLGKKVACVEYERAGGTCLNWGCIPSKTLLKSAELFQLYQHVDDFGLKVEGIGFDFAKIMERSRKVANRMGGGIEFLFKKNKVDYFLGRGHLSAPGIIEIKESRDEGKILYAEKTLVATGCSPRRLPNVEVDGKHVLTSREALALKKLPESITIVGAGAIGVEFAYFFNAFGSKVTLVEMLPQLLPVEDGEVALHLARAFKKQKITAHTHTAVENIKVGSQSVTLDLVKDQKKTAHESEALLLAIGVVPNTEGLLSGAVQPEMERGYFKVGNDYQTNIPGIYAAGDIIGPPWLAHVATFEAVQAVNGMFGDRHPERVKTFPGCTYCQPQVASVGLTEEQAKQQNLKYKVGKFPFQASGKAVAVNHTEGFVKVLISEEYNEILGAHIIGAEATELIQEYVLAVQHELTSDEIHHTIHAHPTMGEALMEAVGVPFGEAIHL